MIQTESHKLLALSLWNFEFCEPAIHADQKLRKDPNGWFIDVPETKNVDANFPTKWALIYRVASLAGHISSRVLLDAEKRYELIGVVAAENARWRKTGRPMASREGRPLCVWIESRLDRKSKRGNQ